MSQSPSNFLCLQFKFHCTDAGFPAWCTSHLFCNALLKLVLKLGPTWCIGFDRHETCMQLCMLQQPDVSLWFSKAQKRHYLLGRPVAAAGITGWEAPAFRTGMGTLSHCRVQSSPLFSASIIIFLRISCTEQKNACYSIAETEIFVHGERKDPPRGARTLIQNATMPTQ